MVDFLIMVNFELCFFLYFCTSVYLKTVFLSWYRNGSVDLTETHGIEMDSLYSISLIVPTWNFGIDMDSWFRHGLMV